MTGGEVTDMEKVTEIMRLLDEAYAHYFKHSDGHCKSAEGHVSLHFGTYFDRRDGGSPLGIQQVGIYSYVFGEGRQKYYDSLDKALAAVREWHKDELAFDYSQQSF